MAKPLNVSAAFYSDFREPISDDHKEVIRVVADEVRRRVNISSFRAMMWVIGAFYCAYFFECEGVTLKVLSVAVVCVALLDVCLYLARRRLWCTVWKSVSRQDYSVKLAKCCNPTVSGFRSTVTVKFDGEEIVVPSLVKPTEEMWNKGLNESNVLLVIVGRVSRLLVIPTEVEYDYV